MAIWESLASAVVGGALGIGGAWLGARAQRKESLALRREQYEREDRYRLHRERIQVYADFYLATGSMRRVLSDASRGGATAKEIRDQLWVAFTKVVLVGNREVLAVASEALRAADRVLDAGEEFDLRGYRTIVLRFQRAARSDLLGVQDLPPVKEQPDEQGPVVFG